MALHLPSINVLRAFEATARHLSFTRAAAELNLTQTAISHRIRELEKLLHVQLFVRNQNAISLTDEGREYLEAIRPALTIIAIATDNVSSVRDSRLKVSCLNAFALRCLIPALPDFLAQHPEIDLRITPCLATDRSDPRDFDVAIWHGPFDNSAFDTVRLKSEGIFPVCTPELLRRGPPLKQPEDLRHYPVVRTVSAVMADEWAAWLSQAGLPNAKFTREIYCEGLHFSMAAISAGLGIGIGRSSLVKEELEQGRLIAPFDLRLSCDTAYFAISRSERNRLPHVRAFLDWLQDRFAG